MPFDPERIPKSGASKQVRGYTDGETSLRVGLSALYPVLLEAEKDKIVEFFRSDKDEYYFNGSISWKRDTDKRIVVVYCSVARGRKLEDFVKEFEL